MTDSVPELGPSDTQVASARLGKMIQNLRKNRDVTSQQLGKSLGWSQSKMSKVEHGAAPISNEELQKIADLLGADETQSRQLAFQSELTKLPPLSIRYLIANGVDRRQRQIAEYEKIAQTIDHYAHSVVPGLLQVPQYTRGMLEGFGVPDPSISRAIEERLVRQRIMAQNGRRFHFILTEMVLHTRPADPETQIEQLLQLRLHAGLRHVRLGIIPTVAGTLPRALTGFSIFNSHFVTTETVVIEQHFTDPSDVRTFDELHRNLSGLAVYGEAADELLRNAIDLNERMRDRRSDQEEL